MIDFEKQYSDLFDYVYRFVRVRIGNNETTDDLVSKIFLDAYEKQFQYDENKGSWRQWITGIAKNSLLNHWRSHKKLIFLEEADLDSINFERFSQQKEALNQGLQFQLIMEASSQNVKNLLIWRYVDDLTYEDIAEILNKTPAAIRKIYSRLHKELKTHFNSDFESN